MLSSCVLRSEALIREGRRLAAGLAEDPRVRAVLLVGSPMIQAADEESDLDLNVYVEAYPDPEARKAAYERGQYGAVLLAQGDSDADHLQDGVESNAGEPSADIRYERTDRVAAGLIEGRRRILFDGLRAARLDVIDGYRMETGVFAASPRHPHAYTRSEAHLADIQDGVVLHDPESLVAGWKDAIADYPEDARREIVWRRLFFAGVAADDMSRALDRGDIAHAFACKSTCFEHYVRALFALNGRYFRKPKALEFHLRDFRRRPENCYARLCEFLAEAGMEKALRLAQALLEDTESIVTGLIGPFEPGDLTLEDET